MTSAWARVRLPVSFQEHIKKPLADEVLFGKLKHGGTVRVDVTTKEDGNTDLMLESIAEKPVKPKKDIPPEKKCRSAGRLRRRRRKRKRCWLARMSLRRSLTTKATPIKSSVPKVPAQEINA